MKKLLFIFCFLSQICFAQTQTQRYLIPGTSRWVNQTLSDSVVSIDPKMLSTTGAMNSTTFYRGDGVWAVPPSGSGGISLTTTGSSGQATLVSSTLNVPNYTLSGLGAGTLATQSGTFSGTSSGTNTGDQTTITGNSGSATVLQTARAINGTNFDGSGAITITAAAGTLTGTTLNSSVVTSSLTSVGTLASGTVPTTLLSGTVTNAQLAGSIAYSKLTLTGAILNADLAGSIDLTSKVTGILPFASNAGTSAATTATTGTMTVSMTTRIVTITPTAACTFNASGGVTGQELSFVITTSGSSAFTLTWSTNYKTTATLSTGVTTAKIFVVTFLCTNGTQWVEVARTIAM